MNFLGLKHMSPFRARNLLMAPTVSLILADIETTTTSKSARVAGCSGNDMGMTSLVDTAPGFHTDFDL